MNGSEKEHFCSVLRTFQNYKEDSLARVCRSEDYLNSLPTQHQDWLKNYRADLQKIRRCIEHNSVVIDYMTRGTSAMFENVLVESDGSSFSYGNKLEIISEGVDKVQSTLKQLFRDWSSEGEIERNQCYKPIIEEIEKRFLNNGINPADIKVLVPGAGLGRLSYEIASRGFTCQGNEFNLFMLIISFFVLNRCDKINELTVFPWVQQYVNNYSVDNQTAFICFPDIVPKTISIDSSRFSMAAGDFLEIYKTPEEWDCVATCFFIDCAHNIVAFIETIYIILKPGGTWVNLGPLLYHFSGMVQSIEPSFETVLNIIKKVGFNIDRCETQVKSKYCQNPKSMLQHEYNSVFFVCTKPLIESAQLTNGIGTSNSLTNGNEYHDLVENGHDNNF